MAVVLAETRFIAHPVTDGPTGGYQVIIADIDQDRKPDLMALASVLKESAWYGSDLRRIVPKGTLRR